MGGKEVHNPVSIPLTIISSPILLSCETTLGDEFSDTANLKSFKHTPILS